MILEHRGLVIDEAELRARCQTTELGTRVENLLACARSLGFKAELEYLTLEQLSELLQEGTYPIVYINMFPTAHVPYPHTVIVERFSKGRVLIVDPLAEPWDIPLSDFLDGWEIYDCMAIVIRPG